MSCACSLDVDLSQQLQPRQRAEAQAADPAAGAQQAPWQGRKEQQEAAAAAAARRPSQGAYPRMPPRRAEATRWERTNKSFTRRVRPDTCPCRSTVHCISDIKAWHRGSGKGSGISVELQAQYVRRLGRRVETHKNL